MEHQILRITNKQDRDTAAMILFRAGYTVRERKEKVGKATVISLEYWR